MTIARHAIRNPLVLGLAASLYAGGALAGAEFSAEMVQQGPQGKAPSGKMYVGEKRVRTEMSHQGQQVIRVTDENRGVEWVLLPDQKQYMERKLGGPPGGMQASAQPSSEDPCGAVPGMTCRKLGEEEVGGRTAVKWEMVASQQGRTMKSTQWIDKDRGVPLRQEMPNGQVTELKFIAEEELNGRVVEKWEMVATMPDQQETRSFQWFDPELGLAIKQKFPEGMVSELTNIRVGKQPDELFNIPAGYERVDPSKDMPGKRPGAEPKN